MSQRSPFPSHLRRRDRPSRGRAALSWAAWVGGAAVLLYMLILGDAGLVRVRSHAAQVAALQAGIDDLREAQAELDERTVLLNTRASFILERVARERYGLARPGERIVHVVGSPAEPGAKAP